jgi:two-component system C4-dicarboxylate transport sensor histidine kinase DctB
VTQEADLEQLALLAEMGVMGQTLVHELRQPLFGAIAAVELELAASSTPSRRLRSALDQLRHLADVVERHHGVMRADEVPVCIPLAAPADMVVAMMRHRASLIGARLSMVVDGEGPWVEAREAAVRQILINLIGNALDAVEGQPERVVEVTVSSVEGRARVAVSDSGRGIDPAVRERLFQRFVTSKPLGRGTGLGLFVSAGLAEGMAGRLTLVDGGAGGAVAALDLPATRPRRAGG